MSSTPLNEKSSIQDIQARFDNDVERFSSVETGQSATIDAPLSMELITQAAVAATPQLQNVLDIGCGAGNNTIKLRSALNRDFDCVLLDLSQPMLDRAQQRVCETNGGKVTTLQADFRTAALEPDSFDVVLAAAVLHHLRDDDDWKVAFEKIFQLLRPGGSVWITDLVCHEVKAVDELMWKRYGDYLSQLGGEEYREKVFAYIDIEDSPRPLTFQLDLLRSVGFAGIDVLHKNSCFAAFGAIKR